MNSENTRPTEAPLPDWDELARVTRQEVRARQLEAIMHGWEPFATAREAHALADEMVARFDDGPELFDDPSAQRFYATLAEEPDLATSFANLVGATQVPASLVPPVSAALLAELLAIRPAAQPMRGNQTRTDSSLQKALAWTASVQRALASGVEEKMAAVNTALLGGPSLSFASAYRDVREAEPQSNGDQEGRASEEKRAPIVGFLPGPDPSLQVCAIALPADADEGRWLLEIELLEAGTQRQAEQAWQATATLDGEPVAGDFNAAGVWTTQAPLSGEEVARIEIAVRLQGES